MFKKLLLYVGIALAILVGTPTVALGGSFVSSLIQGKTPAEAVTIIAEQLDQLFGRVAVLETKQEETDQSVEATQLEIERLRLENENLRLKSENLSENASRDKQAVDTVNRCIPLEKQLTCYNSALSSATPDLSIQDLPTSAPLDEVVSAFGGSWYGKPSTDQVCVMRGEQEDCRSRVEVINTINTDRKDMRERAQRTIEQAQSGINQIQPQFDALQCKATLDEYAPNRPPYGCG